MAAPPLPQPINTNPNTNTNDDNNKDKNNKSKVKGGRPPLPVPSHGTMKSEGKAVDRGVVMGEVEEARGNLQSLQGKVKRWEAKLGRCRELEDVGVCSALATGRRRGWRLLSLRPPLLPSVPRGPRGVCGGLFHPGVRCPHHLVGHYMWSALNPV